jgi:exodeoxyribonuclease VII small subunit
MSDQNPVESYEQYYAQLQSIVARLEAGELSLDESLQLYEQGVTLAAACQRLLEAAELRVTMLQNGGEPQ